MKKTLIAGLALAGLAISPTQTVAQEQPSQTEVDPLGLASEEMFDLAEMRCWDMVTLNEDDRGFALVLLYGYASGKASKSTVSAREVQVAVVNTMQECVDKPDALVLDILETHMHG